MNHYRLVFPLICLLPTAGWAADPPEKAASPENIEAAFKLSVAAAAEYRILVGKSEKPLELIREAKLKD